MLLCDETYKIKDVIWSLQADADVESGGTYSVSEISLADRHLVIKVLASVIDISF